MSPYVLVPVLLLAALLPAAGRGAGSAPDHGAPAGPAAAAQSFTVGGVGGHIDGSATVRIHATRETVFAILGSCPQALKIVPGLETCEVLDRAADGTSARIRQVIEYSRFLPRVRVEVRATYARPVSVTFERIGGDLAGLHGTWTLESAGDFTVAHYDFTLEPGFWVPHWALRSVLKRDLPRMLRGLRETAERTTDGNLG